LEGVSPARLRLEALAGCQIEDIWVLAQLTKEEDTPHGVSFPRFNMPLEIFRYMLSFFLGRVESATADPVRLLASLAAMCCVFQ